ncbi:MAG TPA: PKD domain-containing protein [Phycisphaerae bacterium]|nr:PKD domain-containing protein [Phycisphaerae bacterium]
MRAVPAFLVAALLLFPPPRARAADAFPTGWTFRRALTFKPVSTNAPGENIAWSEFYANGSQKPDGADLRVTTSTGIVVPARILQISPSNDFIRIAFQTRAPDNPYHVWWGNPNADKPAATLDIRRGVLAEVYERDRGGGGNPRSESGIDDMFSRATPVGATFVPSLFLGYNPLGPERGAMIRYTAQFKIDAPVKPDFAFTVLDTGVLKIDGNTIMSQLRGGFRGRVRDSVSVDLAAGWHNIDVTQVNAGSPNTGISVCWRRPGEKGFTPLPPNVFAPIASSAAGPLEKIGTPYAADFTIAPEAEAFVLPDSFIARYSFEAQLPENLANPAVTWDFGDGQILTGQKKINHYFLKPGRYAVTMTIKLGGGGGGSFTTTRRLEIPDRMYQRFPIPPQDGDRAVRTILKDYDLKKLTGPAALQGMFFFKDQGDTDDQIAWGRAWLQTKDPATADKVLDDEAVVLARLLEANNDNRGAADILHIASEEPVGILTRLDLLRQYVMALCDNLDDADTAIDAVKSWQKRTEGGSSDQSRRLAGSLLYAAIAKGDTKLAQSTVAQIGVIKGVGYNDAEIKQGVLARNIEAYIRTSDFETARQLLDQWELDYPASIWDGYTRTLRVKLIAAQGRPLLAARIALAHARANPSGFYAAELLYRAAENFKAAHETTQAQAAMDLLTSKYPESPYARGNAQSE